jgi:SAM-dependent methyltransferase
MNRILSSFQTAADLYQHDNGIWYAAQQQPLSYPSAGNDYCFEIEDKSFWFQHRNSCIVELVKMFPPRMHAPIIDVGGGNGFVAKGLLDAGWDVVVVEPGPAGARNARQRGLPHVVCATTNAAGFKNQSIAAIGLFDVLEHIEDDEGFLRHLHDLLEPGGVLYLTVPANPYAWSAEDVHAGHFRRYTRRTLSRVLADAGLGYQFMTSIFSWLLVPVLLLRAIPYRVAGAKVRREACNSMRSDHSLPLAAAPLVNAVNRWELNRLSIRRPFPVGCSLLCAAQRHS